MFICSDLFVTIDGSMLPRSLTLRACWQISAGPGGSSPIVRYLARFSNKIAGDLPYWQVHLAMQGTQERLTRRLGNCGMRSIAKKKLPKNALSCRSYAIPSAVGKRGDPWTMVAFANTKTRLKAQLSPRKSVVGRQRWNPRSHCLY